MASKLVIVESPAKAKTIARYLGDGYVVESSIGHIRDLPRNKSEVPAEYKDKPWAGDGVDVDNHFEALYIVSPDKKQQVSKLRALLKDADELYLATDEDREGEAIAWHLQETLKPKVPVRRMVFHEITPAAIQAAVANPRELNMELVDAQETRRILDRLVGYRVSEVLWRKVNRGLSAGRVQSVFTRLVVERERERMRFRAAGYWDLEAELAVADPKPGDPTTVTATLVGVGGQRVATGRDFDQQGQVRTQNVVVLDEARATELARALDGGTAVVTNMETRPYRRSPSAPFMTSTLQQEAGRKLRMTAQTAMRTAQRLYENGYITYMRTDSTTLSETALTAARSQARRLYGDDHVPEQPRIYTRKVKNAQEAHEAIRPSGDVFRTPGEVRGEVSDDEYRLYELIWQRTIASQMADATGTTASLRFGADAAGATLELSASGRVITFQGFLRAYVEDTDEPDEGDAQDRRLPVLETGDRLAAGPVTPDGHHTQPPARYTEASLVKTLEELGVGRPSTYASMISNIQDRGYVWKKGSALVPSWTAFAVVGLLEDHFGRLVDYGFTASMEDDLDAIANGVEPGEDWLTRFYFGSDKGHEGGISRAGGLKKMVTERLAEIDAREVNSIPIGDLPDGGGPFVVRVGRYGPYLQAGEERRASVPEDLAPDELTPAKAQELLDAPSGDRELGVDPTSGLEIVAKAGRYGPYVTQVLPEGSKAKPATASLFKEMSLDTVTLDQALELLTLPRVVGTIDGEEVTAQNGRYGPYIKKGSDSRTIESEPQLLSITLDEAKAIFAQPKQRRGRGQAAPPLREVGTDPASGKPVVVKDGRFGPYVTDGETNASLRKGDTVEAITIERAAELLADRRSREPTPKKKATKKAAPRKKAASTKA